MLLWGWESLLSQFSSESICCFSSKCCVTLRCLRPKRDKPSVSNKRPLSSKRPPLSYQKKLAPRRLNWIFSLCQAIAVSHVKRRNIYTTNSGKVMSPLSVEYLDEYSASRLEKRNWLKCETEKKICESFELTENESSLKKRLKKVIQHEKNIHSFLCLNQKSKNPWWVFSLYCFYFHTEKLFWKGE